MHHVHLSQLVLEAFERLPLVASFVKAAGTNKISIVIRRDPNTKYFWRCTYEIREEDKVAKELIRTGPPSDSQELK